MKQLLLAGLVLPALAIAAGAAEPNFIYKCEQPNGTVEYGNGTTVPSGCKRLDVTTNPVITIPSPKVNAQKGPANHGESRPSDFPKVDLAAQRTRDDDRKHVLESELKTQEDRLAELKREFNGGEPERRGDERNYQKYLDRVAQLKDDMARTEANIASLKREIGAVRDATN